MTGGVTRIKGAFELPCFVCGKILECEATGDIKSWAMVNGGLAFHAGGNYGSALFDPVEDCEYLRLVICDDCLLRNSTRGEHVGVTTVVNITADPRPLSDYLVEGGCSPTLIALTGLASASEETAAHHTDDDDSS